MMARWHEKELLASAVRNSAGEGSPKDFRNFDVGTVVVKLTAVTGDLFLDILESFDGIHWYSVVGTLATDPIDDVGDGAVHYPISHPLGTYYKVKWSFGAPGDEAEFEVDMQAQNTEND
jgi:hypothetical protein